MVKMEIAPGVFDIGGFYRAERWLLAMPGPWVILEDGDLRRIGRVVSGNHVAFTSLERDGWAEHIVRATQTGQLTWRAEREVHIDPEEILTPFMVWFQKVCKEIEGRDKQ